MSEHTEQSVRAEVRQWLEDNWDVNLSLLEWRGKLVESGWGAPHWPKEWYGQDLPVGLVPVVEEEIERAGAIGIAMIGIRPLAAATILAHGTDLHKEKVSASHSDRRRYLVSVVQRTGQRFRSRRRDH